MTETPAVITVTPTIQSGTVVRWHRSEGTAESGHPVLSASRDGVMIHGDVFWHDIPREWLDVASAACERLRAGSSVRDLATHQRHSLFGTLTPVGGTDGA